MPSRVTFRNARAEAPRSPADGFRDGGHAIMPEAAERARTRPCALLRGMVEYPCFRCVADGKSDTRSANNKNILRLAPSVYPSRVCLTRWCRAFFMESDT